MPSKVLSKLLRFMVDGTYYRLGGESAEPEKAIVRIVVATNSIKFQAKKKLLAMGFINRFGFIIKLPPLRYRRDDIPLLVSHVLKTSSFIQQIKETQRCLGIEDFVPDQGLVDEWRQEDWRNANVRGLISAVENWYCDKVSSAAMKAGIMPSPPKVLGAQGRPTEFDDQEVLSHLAQAVARSSLSMTDLGSIFTKGSHKGIYVGKDPGLHGLINRIKKFARAGEKAQAMELLKKIRAKLKDDRRKKPGGLSR